MVQSAKQLRLGMPFVMGILAAVLMACLAHAAPAAGFTQVNLVANRPGMARVTDPNLVNPWGLYIEKNGRILAADNGTGLATTYGSSGQREKTVITIPSPAGGNGPAAPTGLVENTTSGFKISAGRRSLPSTYLFATEDGTVSGWNPTLAPKNAILAFDNSAAGAVFKGIALGRNRNGYYLFVTDFHNGVIKMINSKFKLVKSFSDPYLKPPVIGKPGFAPFGIRNIGGLLFVTYALQNAEQHDDVAGVGNGFIGVYTTEGKFIRRFASRGKLNSPWGLALANRRFGQFSNALLIGNFGDGHINAYNMKTGAFLGQLNNSTGKPIAVDGLWSISFSAGSRSTNSRLYFTAGPNHESDGLLGYLTAQRE